MRASNAIWENIFGLSQNQGSLRYVSLNAFLFMIFIVTHLLYCLAYDHNTNAIVGVAYDAFDPDVIVEEFNRMRKEVIDADIEVEDDAPQETVTTIEKGKHFMVFIFQNWTGKHKSIHFVAARYALANLSARWLRKAVCSITLLLASFLFIALEEHTTALLRIVLGTEET